MAERLDWDAVRRLAVACIALPIAVCFPLPVSADAPPAMSPIAGDGSIGHVDGPAASASFMMPAALAYRSDGTLLVADEAAQRIRMVSPAGAVATLAGSGETNASGMWVDGGYKDGPAAQARFDRPDGIAVGSDGTVYVADLGNGCIRAIAHGEVRTFAKGLPSPRALAFDREGTLYVADWKSGVVKIARDGTASPVVPAGVTIDRPTGIVVGNSGPYATLFVGDARGLAEIDLPSLKAKRTPAFQSGDEAGAPEVAGDFPFGVPHALAAFDSSDVVFVDLRDSSVKYFRLHSYARYLGQTPPEDAPLTGGGLDGPDGVPRFDAPMGVAIDAKENVVVADAGNRRIVRLARFDRTSFVRPDQLDTIAFDAKRYRIAVVGSSFSWYFTSSADSIAGKLASDLTSVPALADKPPQGKYFQIGRLTGEFDLIDNVLSLGTADLVVLVVSPIDVLGLGLGKDPAAWSPVVRAGLLKTTTAMRAAKIPYAIALLPAAANVSPLESRYLLDQKELDEATDYESEHSGMLAVMSGITAPMLDLYPAFRSEIASTTHRPLYFSGDVHLTLHGRELVASELARFLETLAPWTPAR